MARGLEFIRSILQNVVTKKNFAQCLKNVQILSAGDGKCKAQFTVTDDHVNYFGTLHGGFTSTIIDCVSTYALLTYKEDSTGGLSVDLHVTFLKSAFPGEIVTIDAKTIYAGKKMAFLTAELTKDDGKVVIAHGKHTKVAIQADTACGTDAFLLVTANSQASARRTPLDVTKT